MHKYQIVCTPQPNGACRVQGAPLISNTARGVGTPSELYFLSKPLLHRVPFIGAVFPYNDLTT